MYANKLLDISFMLQQCCEMLDKKNKLSNMYVKGKVFVFVCGVHEC